MIELPEAVVIAGQINAALTGKQILRAEANHSPHKFAWFTGDPAKYNVILAGKTIESAKAFGGEVEILAGDMKLLISALMRFHAAGEKRPTRHQLLIEFDDGTALSSSIQLWGGYFCVPRDQEGGMDDSKIARQRPSPLSADFTRDYFGTLLDEETETDKISAKEFLATKQRIPGLGNGVLQDILWTAKIHPRRKMSTLSAESVDDLYRAVVTVLHQMTIQGGRDTERDLFDCPGGYKTILSKNTVGQPCPACENSLQKQAFMGGSVYVCEGCQH